MSSALEPQQDEVGLGSLLPDSCQDNTSPETQEPFLALHEKKHNCPDSGP